MPKNKELKRIVRKGGPEHVPVEFYFDGDNEASTYTSFIEALRAALASHEDEESIICFEGSQWRETHTLLPKEVTPKPARWIKIKLWAEQRNTTLFVRDDNVYLVGFENQEGDRYEAGSGEAEKNQEIEQPSRSKADAKEKEQSGRGKAEAKEKKQSGRGKEEANEKEESGGGQSRSAPDEKMPHQILDRATPLGYELTYDGLHVDDKKCILGFFSVKDAIIKLSYYGIEKKHNRTRECIRKHLMRLIVMICEAARMHLIMTRVLKSWRSEDGGGLLDTVERDTLNEWVSMSQAMMGWGTYTQDLKEHASSVLRLIKYAPMDIQVNTSKGRDNPSPKDDDNDEPPPADDKGHGTRRGHGSVNGTPRGDGSSGGNGNDPPPADNNNGQKRQQQGRSLVEMCSIEVTEECTLPGVGVCSITVFDGKRGQVIYWGVKDGDAPRVDSKGNFLLTGPYRAITADGTVALRIIRTVSDSHTEDDLLPSQKDKKEDDLLPSQKNKKEDDLLIWDPYTEDHYDELVSGDIAKGLTLTYAVLRRAVEATVQVDVFLARGTDFFGEISAHSKLANGEEVSVVLFSREIKDTVVFEPSSAGSTVPLTRSVLAWAVGSPLLIQVKSSHSVNLTHKWLRLRTNVEHSLKNLEFSFDDQKDKICFDTLQGFGHIRVIVDDTREYRKKSDSNSLPRSLDQLSRDQTLAATMGFEKGEESSPFENWDDPTRMDILERRSGVQDSMGPEDIGTRTKLLVVRTSKLRLITFWHKMFITCLLHLTNNSNNQHVAFRCGILEEDRHIRRYQLGHSSARTWEFSGILPPNSTSAYLVRHQGVPRLLLETGTLYMTLESCVAWQDEKQVDTIFPAAGEGIGEATQSATVSEPADEATTSEQAEDDVDLNTIFRAAKERAETVTLKATVGDLAMEQAEGDEDLDTFFSRTSKGIKEVTIKATVNHPADVPMTSETEMKVPVTESSINQSDLDVYPLQLRFPFKQDKVICCPLRLTNMTDHYVIFKCLPYTQYSYLYTLDHLNGILPPRSACTYVVVAMEKQKDLPDNMDALSVNLKSCTAEKITDPDEYIFSQDPMPEITTPKAISEKERILPTIEIITVTGDLILSMDVHPTEPWILTSHFNGNVSIWNYQTQARVMEFRESDIGGEMISSTKFIAREKWIVAGGKNGFIYVVTYTTNKKVSEFQAYNERVESLAVHPNQPIVLSTSNSALGPSVDTKGIIMLWNWDVNRDPIWQRTRTFSGHKADTRHVTFNPYDNGNTFASASNDCTVKIWRTNDPNDQPKPIATLDCGQDRQRNVAYFSMGGRQYMITGSLKGAARVWDLNETNRPIKELDGPECMVFGCNVGVVSCVPDNINPVLITVSGDMGISFLDATTYKPRYDKVNFGLGGVVGFADIEVKGRRSLAIAFTSGIAIMEMNEDPVNSPATLEQAQEGTYSAESSKEQ